MTENRRCTICGFETTEMEEGKRHAAIVHANGIFSTLKCLRCRGMFYDFPHFRDHAQQSNNSCRVQPYQLVSEPLGNLQSHFDSFAGQLMRVKQRPEPILIDLTGDDDEDEQPNQNGHANEVVNMELRTVKEEKRDGINGPQIVQFANLNQEDGGNAGNDGQMKLLRKKTTPESAELYQYVRESIKKCVVNRQLKCKKCKISLKAINRNGSVKSVNILAHVRSHLALKLFTCKLCDFKATSAFSMGPHAKKAHPGIPSSANYNDSTIEHIDAIKEMIGQCFGENLAPKSVVKEEKCGAQSGQETKIRFGVRQTALKSTATTKFVPKPNLMQLELDQCARYIDNDTIQCNVCFSKLAAISRVPGAQEVQSENLRQHAVTHLAIDLYECGYCKKSAKVSGEIRYHQTREHKNQPKSIINHSENHHDVITAMLQDCYEKKETAAANFMANDGPSTSGIVKNEDTTVKGKGKSTGKKRGRPSSKESQKKIGASQVKTPQMKCPMCGHIEKILTFFMAHMKMQHGLRKEKVDIEKCKVESPTEMDSSEQLFQCKECKTASFVSSSRKEMERHTAIVHGNGEFSIWRCGKCLGRFYDFDHFLDHTKTTHECGLDWMKIREERLSRKSIQNLNEYVDRVMLPIINNQSIIANRPSNSISPKLSPVQSENSTIGSVHMLSIFGISSDCLTRSALSGSGRSSSILVNPNPNSNSVSTGESSSNGNLMDVGQEIRGRKWRFDGSEKIVDEIGTKRVDADAYMEQFEDISDEFEGQSIGDQENGDIGIKCPKLEPEMVKKSTRKRPLKTALQLPESPPKNIGCRQLVKDGSIDGQITCNICQVSVPTVANSHRNGQITVYQPVVAHAETHLKLGYVCLLCKVRCENKWDLVDHLILLHDGRKMVKGITFQNEHEHQLHDELLLVKLNECFGKMQKMENPSRPMEEDVEEKKVKMEPVNIESESSSRTQSNQSVQSGNQSEDQKSTQQSSNENGANKSIDQSKSLVSIPSTSTTTDTASESAIDHVTKLNSLALGPLYRCNDCQFISKCRKTVENHVSFMHMGLKK